MENRYLRQKELVSQETLKKASVLIGGVGGLGSFSSMYLALAGVGTLVIVDHDFVEESNLNRQVLYTEKDIGKPKVNVASRALKSLNPHIKIIPVQERIDENFDIPYNVDVVVDGLDNMKSRLILEKFALGRNIPYIFGAVEGFMGMVTFIDNSTKKLENFTHEFQSNSPQVLGATAAFTASIQTMEALKYLNKNGDLLRNRLIVYDGLSSNFTEVKL